MGLRKAEASSHGHLRVLPSWVPVVVGLVMLAFLMCLSITQGTVDIPLGTVVDALTRFDRADSQHLMVIDLRLPRVLASALVGAALAVAGAIMQGTMSNPLADSGLLGINSGAGFAIALCFALAPGMEYRTLVVFAFLGAALGAILVMGISFSRKGAVDPLRMILAGAAVSALLEALSQGIALTFEVGLDVLFWTVGGVASVTWSQLRILVPLLSVALVGALLLSPSVSLLNMGEEVARGLGVRTVSVQVLCMVVVLILAGVSVSVVGAVSFVGLIVPHVARFLVGVDYRRIVPLTGVLGALLLVAADLGARTISPPNEIPLGVITALIGVPFFLYLSRRSRRGG